MIHIDFESRSAVDIWQVGAWAYSVHPSTEILCLAYAFNDGDIEIVRWDEIKANIFPKELMQRIREGELLTAQNAFFEQCMWTNQLLKKAPPEGYINQCPRIPIKQWRCSMAKGLAQALPQSLEKVAQALQTQHQKSKSGHTIMLKLCKPNNAGGWNEDPEDFEKLYQYCIDDVAAEREIDKLLPDLIPQEQTYWFLDQLINQRGISVDKEAVRKALSFIGEYTTNLNNIVYQESGFELDRVTRRQAVLDWCKAQGVEIPGYTKSDVGEVLKQDDLPEAVRIVLGAKLELGKTSVAKYQALANSVGEDGRIRDTLIYHGATTGRWTGKLFQLQNLPKGTVKDTENCIRLLKEYPLDTFEIFYPDVMGALSSCIRGMIISSPGCELFVGDYNAIEARVLFWLVQEDYGLRQYSEGKDIYIDMAQRIYDCVEVTKQQRDLGKRAVLGCGYGMGHVKFAATCLTQANLKISEDLARRAIETYRATYANVVSGWYAQENAAIECVQYKKSVVCGRIEWSLDSRGSLLCKLPSGRCLTYPKAFLEYTDTPWGNRKLTLHFYAVDSVSKKWQAEKTYGGKIIENITQAIARDLLAAAMLRVEQAGYPVIFSVHDEIVCEVPRDRQDYSLESWKDLLCGIPQWAHGCPIAAEVWKGNRYKK